MLSFGVMIVISLMNLIDFNKTMPYWCQPNSYPLSSFFKACDLEPIFEGWYPCG